MRLSRFIGCLVCVWLFALSQVAGAVTIEYMAWGESKTLSAHEREAQAFARKYPNSGIVIEAQINEWNTYKDKLFVRAAAGTLPDIVMAPSGFWPEMAEKGFFMDLDPYLKRDTSFDVSQLAADFVTASRINERMYSLPTGGFTPAGGMVSLNLDLFEGGGVPIPQLSWSWDDYLACAKKLTRSSAGSSGAVWGTSAGKSTWEAVWGLLIASQGGHLVDSMGQLIIKPVTDPSRLRVTSAVVEEGFQFLKDLTDVYGVSVAPGFSARFPDGNLAMEHGWSGAARNNLNLTSIRAGVVTSPMGRGGHHGVWPVTGLPHVYAISAQSKDPEAAWKVLKFLVSEPEALRARGFDGLGTVAYRKLVPVYREMVPREWWPWLEVGARYLDMSPKEGNEIWKTVPSQAVTALMEEIRLAYANQQPIRQALDKAQGRMAQIMREQGG